MYFHSGVDTCGQWLSTRIPLFDGHGCSSAEYRLKVEFIHETSRRGKAQTESSCRGIAILHHALGVCDARSLIPHDSHDAAAAFLHDHAERSLAAPGVNEYIPCELGDGRGYGGRFELAETLVDC